jgi:hypothetical protein
MHAPLHQVDLVVDGLKVGSATPGQKGPNRGDTLGGLLVVMIAPPGGTVLEIHRAERFVGTSTLPLD